MSKLITFLAINPPSCDPSCGTSAHCEFGFARNHCECDTGMKGNPYEVCGTEKEHCSPAACGKNAACKETVNGIECDCRSGFSGNP